MSQTRISLKKVLAQAERARSIKIPRVRIHVSAEAIKTATTCNTSHCMIAEAVKEKVKRASCVSVDLQTIRWTDRKAGVRFIYLTPAEAQVALLKFDHGVRPRAFTIDLRNGQIIPTRRGQITKAKRAQGGAAKRTKTKRAKAPSKAMKLITSKSPGSYTIVGGQAPPKATLGNRRIFGLNASHLGRARA